MADVLLVDDLKLKSEEIPSAEEMLKVGPSKQDEDALFGLIQTQPHLVCLSDYATDNCKHCHGIGREAFDKDNYPIVCRCVFANFVKGKWYQPKKIEARLRRESLEHRAKTEDSRQAVAGT